MMHAIYYFLVSYCTLATVNDIHNIDHTKYIEQSIVYNV